MLLDIIEENDRYEISRALRVKGSEDAEFVNKVLLHFMLSSITSQ